MFSKFIKAIILIVVLFLGGSYIAFVGLSKGNDIAVSMTRPRGASSWETSGGAILGYTYIPVIMGIALIVLAIIFSTVLFINWAKKTE